MEGKARGCRHSWRGPQRASKPYLDARLETAKAAWEEAKKVTGDKERIEALKLANAELDPLLSDLNEIDEGLTKLAATLDGLGALRLAGSDDAKHTKTIQTTKAVYTEVNKGIHDARPLDDASAVETAQKLSAKLADARSKADRALKALKPDTGSSSKKGSKNANK